MKNGNFQWIAFNTETFQFFGSGGGTYSAKNGIYTENIQFFSRNNNSVGKILPFNYSLKGVDWHHSGKSSKEILFMKFGQKESINYFTKIYL